MKSISRKTSPFYGQNYPLRFIHPCEYEEKLESLGFRVQYSEVINKTYRHRQENFSFVVIEGRKK